LNNARTEIATVLIASLTPEQRKKIFKMGKDSLQYVQEDYNFAQNPQLKAAEIDLPIWNNDIIASAQLLRVMNVLEPFFNDVEDMLKIIGSEAMDAAQYNYRFLRYKGKEGLPSAQAAYERLRSLRWERSMKSDKPPVV
jgi:hypothetical protein